MSKTSNHQFNLIHIKTQNRGANLYHDIIEKCSIGTLLETSKCEISRQDENEWCGKTKNGDNIIVRKLYSTEQELINGMDTAIEMASKGGDNQSKCESNSITIAWRGAISMRNSYYIDLFKSDNMWRLGLPTKKEKPYNSIVFTHI